MTDDLSDFDEAETVELNGDNEYTCAYCFQQNPHWVDPGGGKQQQYTEDCQVCCRPNVLFIHWDEWQACYRIDSEPELG